MTSQMSGIYTQINLNIFQLYLDSRGNWLRWIFLRGIQEKGTK